ncbi:transcriptional repressor for RNA polymerase II [Nosema bombycis CQ1]|uniref:Transcriptional repressor for RNA polymerase II n=1 Tax=Nosema bombycis (strain CQ1 / CVCC 102059) TaxID=578461 RepID=R0LZX4_NOSB1|nr:transcriptional repressor for RNA polymerase II [Nosema bombycis CQ1]|eukprot:EOB11319.1 transcriptional repressor for RNA polymerase II [Nosema bombycis CQ1]
MYQPDINTFLEAIKQEFENIKKDNKLLKQENLKLIELNNQYLQKLASLSYKEKSVLKLGSDWDVEGDNIFEISLNYKISIGEPITSLSISYDGIFIAFVSGNSVYILVDQIIYLLENEKMVKYDKYRNKRIRRNSINSINGSSINGGFNNGSGSLNVSNNGLLNPSINSNPSINNPSINSNPSINNILLKKIFFSKDNHLLFVVEPEGFIKVWDIKERSPLRSFNLPEVKSLYSYGDLVYAISIDRTLRVYDKDKIIIVITTNEDLEGPLFLSKDKKQIYCKGKSSLIFFDLERRSYNSMPIKQNEECKINNLEHKQSNNSNNGESPSFYSNFTLISNLGFLCLSSKTTLNFYKTNPPRFLSSNQNEECNYCLCSFGNVLVVGHKNGISFYDIKNKRKMKINIEDSNTYNIDCSDNKIVTVETGV